jgi:2',3'-cyclic-nucleotide 2'-phosphodiesterase (5'-nucleotidase family)
VRKSSSNVLVLDAGDSLIRDRPPALTSHGKSSVESMNMMGYDAMALGASDLALLGVDGIRQRMQEAHFPFLSANAVLTETGELLAQPYILKEMKGRQIAVIGLTDEVRLRDVEIRDPLLSLREVLNELDGQADILVLLSHAGFQSNQKIAQRMQSIREAPEIDMIISGGGQGYTAEPQLVEGQPPLVQADTPSPGHAGRRVGVGSWGFDDDGQLVALDWMNLALAPDVPDDPEMARWAAAHP